MRLHSKIGLVSNSSSTIYTWYNTDPARRLMDAGQSILDALGLDQKAEEVFEIKRELNADFLDRFYDDPSRFIDDEDAVVAFEVALDGMNGILEAEFGQCYPSYQWDDEQKRSFYDRRAVLEAELHSLIDIDKLEDGYEDCDGYTTPAFDFFLVNKSTGRNIDIASMFSSIFNQEAGYN